MTEAKLWSRMREVWKDELKMWRVENQAGVGLPDVHYLYEPNRITGWIELKYISTINQRIPLRKAQIGWHKEYAAGGGKSFVIVQAGGSSGIYCFEGRYAQKITEQSLLSSVEMFYKARGNLPVSEYQSEDLWKMARSKVQGYSFW